MQLTKRLAHGFTSSGSYTWSRSLGTDIANGMEDQVVNSRDPRNRSLDKALLTFHRTHLLTTNATVELPFGPGRQFLSNSPGFVQRLVERWQLGGIFSWSSGPPLTITAPIASIWQTTNATTPTGMTPNIVGDFPKSSGQVTA